VTSSLRRGTREPSRNYVPSRRVVSQDRTAGEEVYRGRPSLEMWSARCTSLPSTGHRRTPGANRMNSATRFFSVVLISCTASAAAAQNTAQQPGTAQPQGGTVQPQGTSQPGESRPTPEQLLPVARPTDGPGPVTPTTTAPTPAGNTVGAPTATPPAAARPCGQGRTPAPQGSSSAASSQSSGVSASQLPRAGVSADAFERPGVSTAQLSTLIPGAAASPCSGPPRDVVLYPEPAGPPRRIPSADSDF